MGNAKAERAERLIAETSMRHQKSERRLAGPETAFLERRPLIKPGRDQNDAAQRRA